MTKKRKRRSGEQIIRALREGEAMLAAGKSEAEVFQLLGISEVTWKRWQSQFGGMKSEEARRLKELELENQRLKELLAEAELDKKILKMAAEGNFYALAVAVPQFKALRSSIQYQSVELVRCWANRAARNVINRSRNPKNAA